MISVKFFSPTFILRRQSFRTCKVIRHCLIDSSPLSRNLCDFEKSYKSFQTDYYPFSMATSRRLNFRRFNCGSLLRNVDKQRKRATENKNYKFCTAESAVQMFCNRTNMIVEMDSWKTLVTQALCVIVGRRCRALATHQLQFKSRKGREESSIPENTYRFRRCFSRKS